MGRETARAFAAHGAAVVLADVDAAALDGVASELPESLERIAGGLPMRRMGHPGDMASAILFLSSEAASFVHGSTLDVDGGGMLR
jgi:NAD(P)-dependent dehydrogenase (short-subunit alcohol dehydrogenase family)